jgi:hypothetical protein
VISVLGLEEEEEEEEETYSVVSTHSVNVMLFRFYYFLLRVFTPLLCLCPHLLYYFFSSLACNWVSWLVAVVKHFNK